jgi:predicted GTPase
MEAEFRNKQVGVGGVEKMDAIKSYDELKLAIGRIAQDAIQLCREVGDQERVSRHQAILARLVEDRFNLAVLGQFSRGKSTLMNALMGMDRLPTGVLPHTSVVTTVSYGDKERILVRCEGWPLAQEIGFAELTNYVTESGNPENRRRVISADIQMPVEMLRRGLVFVDTPGVGSAVAENTRTTMRYLPEIDAAIFVTGFESPLSDAEMEFLRETLQSIGKVFVVVNKQDLVSEEERAKVVRHIEERLSGELGEATPRIFAVSAREALSGRLAGDQRAVNRSGLPALQDALFHFLGEGKVPQLCKRTLERIRGPLEMQQAEFASASDSTKALTRIEKTIEAQQCRRVQLAARAIAEMHKNLLPYLDSTVSRIFSDLKASIITELGAKLIYAGTPLGVTLFRGGMKEASVRCAERLSSWQGASAAELEQAVRASAGVALRDLEALPADTWARIVESGTSQFIDSEDDEFATLTASPVEILEWSGRPPWTIYLVPIQWIASAINGWFTAAAAELLSDYRDHLFKGLVAAADIFLGEVNREVESRINDYAARMTRTMKAGVSLVRQKRLKELSLQLGRVRESLVDSGFSRWASTAGSREGNTALTNSSERERAWSACPVCVSVTRAIFDYLARQQYDMGTQRKSQVTYAESGGFCGFHTWAYEALASPQSICHAYPELLDARAAELQEAAALSTSTAELRCTLRHTLQDGSRCPACELVRITERQSAHEVVSRVSGESEDRIPAFCVPHLCVALENVVDLNVARRLVTATGITLEAMADAMTRFALKFDAVKRGLVTSTERSAYSAGLGKLVGARTLATNSAEYFG